MNSVLFFYFKCSVGLETGEKKKGVDDSMVFGIRSGILFGNIEAH
jgi:hypothetical protein